MIPDKILNVFNRSIQKVSNNIACYCNDPAILSDFGDCINYMIRFRWTRIIYKEKEISCRPCHKIHYTRGDIVIVNDNLKHYRGEIQVVLKDMEVDGQRNLLGHIDESEIFILDHIKAKDVLAFIEK